MQKRLPFLLLLVIFLSCAVYAQNPLSLTPSEFQKQLSSPEIQLLDVRTREEFTKGTINNSLHADWLKPEEFMSRAEHLDKTKPVYVFCASGGRSKEAAKSLAARGFEVYELKGGTNEWKKQGNSLTEKETQKQISLEEYLNMIPSTGNVLVDFGAPWCPPCRKMEPEIGKLNQAEIQLIKLDPGIHIKLAEVLGINTIPTFIYYKNGNEVGRSEGLTTAKAIEAKYR